MQKDNVYLFTPVFIAVIIILGLIAHTIAHDDKNPIVEEIAVDVEEVADTILEAQGIHLEILEEDIKK
jgi:hypothetical protein